MIEPAPDMLVFGPKTLDAALVSLRGCYLRRDDPYTMLEDLSSGVFGAVVLSACAPDMPGLCRAARRLLGSGRLLALVPPADEPAIRELVACGLDDYFIYPPADDDIEILRRAASEQVSSAATEAPIETQANELAELMVAAQDPQTLKSALARLVERRLASPVRWEASGSGSHDHELLRWPLEPREPLLAGRTPQPDDAQWLSRLAEILPALAQSATRTQALYELAVTDHLTGAHNRRFFYEVTDQILQQAAQRGARATLLLYDIDDFKHYNDTYGYAAGDEVLRETAALMRRIVRSHDIVARIGGDEFAVLFWDHQGPRAADSSPPQTALVLAERFRREVNAAEFPSLGPEAQGRLSISGGLANFPADGKNVRELLRSADHALKAGKRLGKNAINLAGHA